MSRNGLHGTIPKAILMKLTNLVSLDVSENILVSSTTTTMNEEEEEEEDAVEDEVNFFDLSKMKQLSTFNIADNKFHGTILPTTAITPTSVGSRPTSTLSLLTNMKYFNISHNSFSGSLYSNTRGGYNGITSVGTFYYYWNNLEIFDISYNKFAGQIALEEFHKARMLERLDISHNSFSSLGGSNGNIFNSRFFPSLTYFNANHNQLVGVINDDGIGGTIATVTQLQDLHLSDNELSGTIPSSLQYLSNSLRVLDVSNNQLNKKLPAELGTLSNLVIFDIHSNKFTGTIPTEYIQWTSLGKFFVLSF